MSVCVYGETTGVEWCKKVYLHVFELIFTDISTNTYTHTHTHLLREEKAGNLVVDNVCRFRARNVLEEEDESMHGTVG